MKWILIKETHINADNLDEFLWKNGSLFFSYNGCEKVYECPDPDQALYRKLCGQLGVIPFEEVTESV